MQKYDPEDIEQLMLHKSYDELLEQEKTYVLKHLDSKEDYTQMRATLLSIKEGLKQDDFITPSPRIKTDLLALFEKEERRGFWWFVGVLFPEDKPLFYRPAMQFATVLVLVLGTFFILNQFNENPTQVAYVSDKDVIKDDFNDRKATQPKKTESKERNYESDEGLQKLDDAPPKGEAKTKPLEEERSDKLKSLDEDLDLVSQNNEEVLTEPGVGDDFENNEVRNKTTEGSSFGYADMEEVAIENQSRRDEVSPVTNSSSSLIDNSAPEILIDQELALVKDLSSKKEKKRALRNSKNLASDDEWIDLFYTAL